MRDAVLLLDLRRRHLEVAAELELAVDDVVDRVRAPGQRVVGAAARPAAAAPLVGEDDLGAVVVEGRRVPVGEALVDDLVDALRVQRVGDVEQDAVARAGAGGDPALGEHGDVVALVGAVGLLGVVAVVAAPPQPGQDAGLGVGEHGRAVDDARLGRLVDRDLDDVDAEQRGALVAGRLVDAARHLLLVAHDGGPGVVDDDLAVLARAGDDRVRVRAAAGLDRADLHRPCQVADVEDAKPAEALGADVLVDALEPAIEPPSGLLDRHDQQVADDGDVALPARADHRAEQLRHSALGQPVDVEAVVAAGHHHVAGEGHVGVGETQQRRALVVLVLLFLRILGILRHRVRRFLPGGLFLRRLQVFRRQLGRVAWVKETGRLGERGHEFQVLDRHAGVIEPGLESRARVGGQPDQERVHALDLGGLVVGDVRGELEQHRIVGRAGLFEQLLDHRHRALVVGDHQRQEQPVEVRAFGGSEFGHLLRRGHAGHRVVGVHCMVFGRIGHRLAALTKPVLHELDLVSLRCIDAPGDVDQLLPVRAVGHQRGHLDGLVMVRDHVLHEPGIRRRVARIRDLNGLIRAELTRRLARRPRLNDRRLGDANGGATRQKHGQAGTAQQPIQVIRGHDQWCRSSIESSSSGWRASSQPQCIRMVHTRRQQQLIGVEPRFSQKISSPPIFLVRKPRFDPD